MEEANPTAWPAWIQAIGSVIAIAVAIYVPFRVQQVVRLDAERERRLKARSIAVAVYPSILELKAKMIRIKSTLQRLHNDDRSISANVVECKLEVPREWGAFLQEYHLLDEETGAAIQQVIAVAHQYRRMWEDLWNTPDPDQINERMIRFPNSVNSHVEQIETSIGTAIKGLDNILAS